MLICKPFFSWNILTRLCLNVIRVLHRVFLLLLGIKSVSHNAVTSLFHSNHNAVTSLFHNKNHKKKKLHIQYKHLTPMAI